MLEKGELGKEDFIGNHKIPNFQDIVEELVNAYEKMGCRMSLKLHILHSRIDGLKDNLGDYTEEQGERFHQDVKSFEEDTKANIMKTGIFCVKAISRATGSLTIKFLFEVFLLTKFSCKALRFSNQAAIFHHIHIEESHIKCLFEGHK